MSLLVTVENSSIYEKDKPESGNSGSLSGPTKTDSVKDTVSLAGPVNFDKGLSVNQGFKVFPHCLIDHPVWLQASIKYRMFFFELLMRCTWKETSILINGNLVELTKGQFACSIRMMASIFSPCKKGDRNSLETFSRDDVVGAIRYFQKSKFLRQELRQNLTILTITEPTICEKNFSYDPTTSPTTLRQRSDSDLKEPYNHTTKDIVPKGTLARSCAKPRWVDPLKFCFESGKFVGITPQDIEEWSAAYPCLNIEQEIPAAVQWVKSNPTKVSSRKLWRKFLTGWFSRNNEKAANREAYSQNSSKKSSASNREKVLERFRHGEKYRDAECFINEESIAFHRGMQHMQVKFNEYGFWDKFKNILYKLGINE